MAKTKPQSDHKYKFSFVMPIYDVEDYLVETVESILGQTMDFEKNCEIIFVNDGSPDASEEICLAYKDRFPGNISYIKQKNQGVSSARNRGTRKARGKYISFLDSDDKLSSDTLVRVYEFLEAHAEEVDLVAIKLWFFEAESGPHPLNDKFSTSRVININEEYSAVQLSAASSFIKTEVMKKYEFDSLVGHFAEDAKLLTEIILEKMAYGVVEEPVYYYRKRLKANSAIDTSQVNPAWYLKTPRDVYGYLFEYATQKLGYIPKYVQYLVMYELRPRFKQSDQHILTEEDLTLYKQSLWALIDKIEDGIILNQSNFHREYKYYILTKKYGESVLGTATREGLKYFYRGRKVYDFGKSSPSLYVEEIERVTKGIILKGYFSGFLFNGVSVAVTLGNESKALTFSPSESRRVEYLGEEVYRINEFTVLLPIEYGLPIRLQLIVGDKKLNINPKLLPTTGINLDTEGGYRVFAGLILLRGKSNSLFIQKSTLYRRLVRRIKYWQRKNHITSSPV